MVDDAVRLAHRAWPDPDRVPEHGQSILCLLWLAGEYLREVTDAERAGAPVPRMPLLVARDGPRERVDGPATGPSADVPRAPTDAAGASARGIGR